jgi:hypothetical protein
MRRSAAVLLLSVWSLLAAVAPAAAGVAWRISASPTSFPEGSSTRVVLTVTGGSQAIGLLTLTIASGYRIVGATVLSVPAGQTWTAVVASPALVTFQTAAYPTCIRAGDVARFAITVVATSPSPPPWVAASYRQSATPAQSNGDPLAPLPAFNILPAPTSTPPPTARPTTSSSPAATASPSPTAGSTPTAG